MAAGCASGWRRPAGRRRVERAPRAGPGRELLHVRVVSCCDRVRCRRLGRNASRAQWASLMGTVVKEAAQDYTRRHGAKEHVARTYGNWASAPLQRGQHVTTVGSPRRASDRRPGVRGMRAVRHPRPVAIRYWIQSCAGHVDVQERAARPGKAFCQ